MPETLLAPDDLLAGTDATFDVTIPHRVLSPRSQPERPDNGAAEPVVRLRPMAIGTFQLIMRAAKSDAGLIPLLMIKESLVEPALSLEQVKRMHLGLVNFLIAHIRAISGLTEKEDLDGLDRSPLAQASYRLARAFGWTPQQIQAMTMAQVSMFLHMLDEDTEG